MFKNIFIEKDIQNTIYTQNIVNHFNKTPISFIDDYANFWGKTKKPYLQKRDNLNLFVARKKGQIVKLAPDAYGKAGEPHFYFIHAYNCIYECEYCFLQGYFNTPDIVLFVNHEEICQQIEETINKYPNAWFHAGEFSDSLALSHITKELDQYHELFSKYPNAKLEFRTKSSNIRGLQDLAPLKNMITSFSLSPSQASKSFDLKTPSTMARLKAIDKLNKAGHKIGLHLDPIIYSPDLVDNYQELANMIKDTFIDFENLAYISIGVVRYTEDVFRQVQSNYPDSALSKHPYTKSFDQKIRYSRPMRSWILNQVENIFHNIGLPAEKIYRCME